MRSPRKIINSTASSTVVATVAAAGSNAARIGGLVGSIEDTEITGSRATGNITGEAADAGGLVGFSNTSTISDSDASGNVTGATRVGGLVGSAEGTAMRRNDASGNVSGSVHSVGGSAGHLYQSDVAINQATGSVVGDNSTDPAVEKRCIQCWWFDRHCRCHDDKPKPCCQPDGLWCEQCRWFGRRDLCHDDKPKAMLPPHRSLAATMSVA